MLYIDDQFFDHDYFSSIRQLLATHSVFSSDEFPRIAVCIEDQATWLAVCLFCKEQQRSIMPIHPSTPLDGAKRLAKNAGCYYLFFGNLDNIILVQDPIKTSPSKNSTPGLIQMSSGTTGDPKCIERSWESIEIEITNYIDTFQLPNAMTPLIACPITHSYGLISGVLVALARGATPHIITNINPKFLIRTLTMCEKPLLYSSPTMLLTIATLWPEGEAMYAAMTSGTAMSKESFKRISPKVTHLFQQYGCSEAGCISINQNMQNTIDIGTPLPHFDVTSGTSCEEPAEIIVSYKTSDSSSEESRSSIHTQDLGYFHNNAEGKTTLSYISRLDDTIIVAGLNVYPQEVEDIILNHPSVTDAVIFQAKDPIAGHRVGLQFVSNTVMSNNTKSDLTFSENDLRQWCLKQLAPHQVPNILLPVKNIKRMANGKISRKKIAQEYQHKIDIQKIEKDALAL